MTIGVFFHLPLSGSGSSRYTLTDTIQINYPVQLSRRPYDETGYALFQQEHTPTVVVTTKNLSNSIHICVKDSGPGKPDEIKDKIFQPFFSTKPAGQGSVPGLSLSYHIVKTHGGLLKLETNKGEVPNVTIVLPT